MRSIGFNLSFPSEERNTISLSEAVTSIWVLSCRKEANKKCPTVLHRWQYLVLMASRGNLTGHMAGSLAERRGTLYKLSLLLSEYDRLTPTLHHCNEGPAPLAAPPANSNISGKNIKTFHPQSINPMLLFNIFPRTTLLWVAAEHMKTYHHQSITPRLFVQILLSSAFFRQHFCKDLLFL